MAKGCYAAFWLPITIVGVAGVIGFTVADYGFGAVVTAITTLIVLAISAWFYTADEGVFIHDDTIDLKFRFLKRRIAIKEIEEVFELTIGEGVDPSVVLRLKDGAHLFLPERLGLADHMHRVSLYYKRKMTKTSRQFFPTGKKSPR